MYAPCVWLKWWPWRRLCRCVAATHKTVAQELASKRYQVTPRSWYLVRLLQNHILENPHMKVAWHGDSEAKVSSTPSRGCALLLPLLWLA